DRWRRQLERERTAAWEKLTGDADGRRELAELAAAPCSDPADKLGACRDEAVARIRDMLDGVALPPAKAFDEITPPKGNIGSAKAWGGKETVLDVRRRLVALVASVKALAPCAEDLGEPDQRAAKLLATLVRLAGDAARIYAAAKRRAGRLDFTDLLDLGYKLLRDDPGVRGELGAAIEQLLVDEAQDTDTLQVRMLERLVFGTEHVRDPAEGKLFLVGDGKQSIYRFRGARVEVFKDLCGRLGAEKQVDLDTSFRTHAAGIALVNHLFAPLMGADYTPIRAHRQEVPPRPSVELVLARRADGEAIGSAADASDVQAAATAARLAEMFDQRERLVWDRDRRDWRPVEHRDVAILFARMTNTLQYERELLGRAIPYYVVGGTGFFRRQEVFDVLNALRVIDNPFDDVALTGALRSSLFGLDDNALMHVAQCCDPPYFWKLLESIAKDQRDGTPRHAVAGRCQSKNAKGASEIQKYLSENLDPTQLRTLGYAVRLLAELHARKDAVGIDRLIERLLDATGYEAAMLSQPHGRRMVGNVRRVIELSRDAAAGDLALADFLAEMDELIVDDSRFEQAAVAGEADDVVRLMTIHKAKGLEFPVVVIPDLNAGRMGFQGDLLHRTDWGLTFRLRTDEQEQTDGEDLPLSFRLAKQKEGIDQQKEDIRKLYVAVTRHRDHLILVGADYRGKDSKTKERTGTFLAGASYLARIDDVLGVREAIDAGRSAIPYGKDGRYAAAVRVVSPTPPARGGGKRSQGDRLIAEAGSPAELAEGILRAAAATDAPPLLGPLPSRIGRAELAVTALSEFEHCPMLYRWRYELRVPEAAPGGSRPGGTGAALDAATMGTFYHRCMELLDFAAPQEPGALVRRVAGEMDLEEVADLGAIAAELAGMLRTFSKTSLWKNIAAAERRFAELDFVMGVGAASLRGQIDLLYEDGAGAWHIVDYKSDRVGPEGIAAHAQRYELQMLAYAAAADRHLGSPPADATLYFLRTGRTHPFVIGHDVLHGAAKRIESLAAALIAARRSGRFARSESGACPSCPYGPFCRSAAE
ncbi:MAG TPA: PD-(D/E)XK nuclease family protein, partial [Phycisphaerae bacterium]|nr:PD-(D/E)XK nuclease family protein [Phycisphaerae bacterium]